MKIYHYSRETGEFLAEGNSTPDPLSGREEYPAFCAVQPPPVTGSNETAVYRRPDGGAPKNPSNGEWSVLDDYRGHTIWKKSNAQEFLVTIFGSVPEAFTLLDPASVEYPKWVGTGWVTDAAAKTKAEAKVLREQQIANARTASGVRGLTVDQAVAYIEAELDTAGLDATVGPLRAASNLATAKAAIEGSLVEMRKLVIKEKEVLLKMIPYLLD